MDERRQGIVDLKKRLEDYIRSLDAAKEKLGAVALSDVRAEKVLAEDASEEKRLTLDLMDARAAAKSIQETSSRLQTLRLAERERKRELETLRRDLFELRARLGESALGSPNPPSLFVPFKERIELVAARIEEQEARIAELENADDDGGLIAHLGRSAKSLILRSSQASRRAEGRRILSEAGAALALADEVLSSEEDSIREAAAALIAHGECIASAEAEIADIQKEVKELSSTLATGDAGGNPRRAVARMEKMIAEGEASLASLRREVGARLLAASEGKSGTDRRKDPFDVFAADLLSEESAAEPLAKARAYAASIVAAKRQMEKLEASLRIDALSSELTKLRGAVTDHERRIAASKRALEDLGLRIAEAERGIASLSELRADK
jgi:chromosome segregation ATPase